MGCKVAVVKLGGGGTQQLWCGCGGDGWLKVWQDRAEELLPLEKNKAERKREMRTWEGRME